MANVSALLAERTRLDSEIAAKKQEAIQQVRDFMVVMGVTVEDLIGGRRPASVKPPKYRNAEGKTWTGVGQRPRWLREALLAGATLEQFAVGKQ